MSAARIAIATSAAVPCWNRPITSRVSAGLRLSNVAPDVESHHSPAMKCWNVGGVLASVVGEALTAVSVMARSVDRRSGGTALRSLADGVPEGRQRPGDGPVMRQ